MDIGLIKSFIEVNRNKHFGRAAKALFISQSAVSARIKQLEDELGVRLFVRDRNNIVLTTAGKKFLVYAENILTTWNKARHEIAIPEGSDLLLSIGGLPSLWDIFVDDWLVWVIRQNPSVSMQSFVMRSDALIRSLLDGTMDLGFVLDPPKTPELYVKDILPLPLVMVSTKEGISQEEAVSEDYIFVDWGTSFAMMHARQFADMPPPRLRANTGGIALGLLRRIGGAAYLPEAMIKDQIGEGLFLVKDAPTIEKDAYAVYSNEGPKRQIIENSMSWFDEVTH